MSKKLVFAVFASVAVLFGSIYFISSSKAKGKYEKANPAFREYITAYTSGYVSTEAKIQIVLAKAANELPELNKELDNNLFDFSPSIDGKIIWIDDHTVEFKPAARLKQNQLYSASFKLNDVADVPNDLKTFEFNFQTIPQAIDVEVHDYIITDQQSYKTIQITGLLSTADFAEHAMVEKCFNTSHPGSSLKITWNHESSTRHRFIVDGIQKSGEPSVLMINVNGEAIDSKTEFSREITIPVAGQFNVMANRVTNEPDQAVNIYCTDIIQAGQNLDGLIKIESVGNDDSNYDYYESSYSNNPSKTAQTTFTYAIDGNIIKIYPTSRLSGSKTIVLGAAIKNSKGKELGTDVKVQVEFEELKPAVKINGKGVILPNSEGLIFPFEAVNINAVDVQITKIYETNVLQFLQVNNLSGKSELMRVGKTILKKKIPLNSLGELPRNKNLKYALDLSKLIAAEPGAIYNVKLSFKRSYSIYDCNGDTTANLAPATEAPEDTEKDEKDWDYYGSYYSDDYEYGDYYDYYDYRERENPCTPSYYSASRSQSRNILASNIGLLAKKGNDGSYLVMTSDIVTAKPMSGVSIEAYDFQQQLMGEAKTDGTGLATFEFKRKPFVLIAKSGQERNYLKLEDGLSNSLSSFEVNGEIIQKGLKGFIYGERGVWRPGDSLFLSFMLEDKDKKLPLEYPVTMELINPMGQVVQKLVQSKNVDGIYDFRTKTDNYAPTGNYTAKVKAGGAAFTKTIKIETIMPNRLKLNLDFNTKMLTAESAVDLKGTLQVNWLHGAVGKNLESKIDVTFSPTSTEFKGYKGYTFDNPASGFYSESQTIFDGRTDENGFTQVNASFTGVKNAPGFLNANFTVRAFEEGGAFSTDRFSMPFSPYTHYVGVKIPEAPKERGYLETDTDQEIKIATVDENGNPASREVTVKVYKVSWRWWWDNYNDDLSSYVGNDYKQAIYTEDITTSGGKASFKFKINYPEWGRYLVYVTDKTSGHSAGQTMFIDWPSWQGKSPKGNEGATMLNISSDKTEYNVGDEVKLSIPSGKEGKALISLETGTKVLQTFWIDTKNGVTDYSFKVTDAMTPNIYVHATLIQPHGNVMNDLPIRLYGVLPLMIKDEKTVLKPKITCADSWRPESEVEVKVSEEQGKEMAYTLAIVDEGLLDITRFKTPDPWSTFYAKEALGVKTWDIFDMIIGASGKVMQRILSIGGDSELDAKSGSNAQRFKPMVRFVGPFKLDKGESNTHKIKIPQYVGAVRVMVVAAKDGAYGNSEKSVKVKKPLMILSTLPRVLGPDEEVDLPVTVFAMEDKVKNATITVVPDKHFTVMDEATKSVEFTRPDDKVVTFRLKVRSVLGVAKVKIKATGAGESTSEEIEIEIRTPNPYITDVSGVLADKGKNVSLNYKPFGIAGTNKAVLEISSMPPINLQKRIDYLIQYPHGCVEQTTSSVFAQLFLKDVVELSDAQSKVIQSNIKAAINRLKGFQTASGGLAYWQGLNVADEWGTNYAGHFLLEAQKAGYSIPYGLMDNWKRYQKDRAQNWTASKNAMLYQEDLTQAYRLYTLALAGASDLGSMNRLKESKNLSVSAKWRLAAAYEIAGQTETAKKLINSLSLSVKPYTEYAYTYGSSCRDEAMILETLTLLKMKSQGFEVLTSVAKQLSSDDWMSTQTTAYSLLAVTKYAKTNKLGEGIAADCKINGANVAVSTTGIVKQIPITNAGANASITVNNKGKGPLFVRLIRSGIPTAGQETAKESNVKMMISYTTLKGEPLDVSALDQGTDFVATVTIMHPGIKSSYKNMALTQVFPSGWEIHNSRLDENQNMGGKSDLPTYQDIRDDRVYTYFDLYNGGSKTYKVVLNAAYCGRFYLPTVYTEAMYDNTVSVRQPGMWIDVVKGGMVK
ncbi:MAG: MG2 domain-containing protein [Bacteroidota bacterium]|nr:MG2 domain-containing protein [Bacteroidota bacterium]